MTLRAVVAVPVLLVQMVAFIVAGASSVALAGFGLAAGVGFGANCVHLAKGERL